jgi:hypothetical protein
VAAGELVGGAGPAGAGLVEAGPLPEEVVPAGGLVTDGLPPAVGEGEPLGTDGEGVAGLVGVGVEVGRLGTDELGLADELGVLVGVAGFKGPTPVDPRPVIINCFWMISSILRAERWSVSAIAS